MSAPGRKAKTKAAEEAAPEEMPAPTPPPRTEKLQGATGRPSPSPRKKATVLLKSGDGKVFEVEVALALRSHAIRRVIEDGCAEGSGGAVSHTDVKATTLDLAIQYFGMQQQAVEAGDGGEAELLRRRAGKFVEGLEMRAVIWKHLERIEVSSHRLFGALRSIFFVISLISSVWGWLGQKKDLISLISSRTGVAKYLTKISSHKRVHNKDPIRPYSR